MRGIYFLNLGVLALFLTSSCGFKKTPTESDVREYLTNGYIELGLVVNDVGVKFFPHDQGLGRASLKGHFRLATDLYSSDFSVFGKSLEQAGISKDIERACKNYFKLNPNPIIYSKTYREGQEIPFSGELEYIDTVDGFVFSGDVNHEKINGIVAPPVSALIYGSSDYDSYLKSWIDCKERFVQMHKKRMSQASEILLNKEWVAKLRPFDPHNRDNNYYDQFTFSVDENIQWKENIPNHSFFETNMKIEWLRPNKYEDHKILKLQGEIEDTREKNQIIRLTFKLPDSWQSTRLTWSGDYFCDNWSGGCHWKFIPIEH